MGELINFTAHGLVADDTIMLGNLVGGEGLEENTLYYVLADGLTADAFKVSESQGGAAVVFTTDITDGVVVTADTYEPDSDGPHSAPTEPAAPSPATLTSLEVSGIVRLFVELPGYEDSATRVREFDVEVTHAYDGATPLWEQAQSITLPSGSTTMSIPALGSTLYATRTRVLDVFGNYSEWSTVVELTTDAGVDAKIVPDASITGPKIAPLAIETDHLSANSITADKLAATIILASLIQTGAEGTRRVELDTDGVRLLDSDNSLLVRIPTNGDPVYIKGQVNADSLISQTAAEFRTAVSFAASSVATLENGTAAPTLAPTVSTLVPYIALGSTPADVSTAAGIGYDSGAFSYWIAADPTAAGEYVAHEFSSGGSLLRSITATGSISTTTTTLGSTSHVSDTARAESGSSDNQVATPLTMPRDGRITKVSFYAKGYSGSCTVRGAVWSSTGNTLLEVTDPISLSSAALATGASDHENHDLQSELSVTSGTTYRVGWFRSSTDGFQWDEDQGGGKTTYVGDGGNGAMSGESTDTSAKPNVYITYEYDTDTRLETAPMIAVCTDGTYIYTLDTTGVVWKYDRTTLAYVSKSSVQTAITGTKSKAGMFYDATATELIITTSTGTGAGVYPKFVRVNPSTLAVSASVYSASAGSTYSGTTDTFRGGARLADPLNSSAATYWVPISGTVQAYTFTGSTATQVSNRSFGTTATCSSGLTHNGTAFRGYSSSASTKINQFTAWDFTTTSTTLWVGYSWYDGAGTTHETAMGPRTSVTIRRREQVLIATPAVPTGGVDDPNNARVYALQNASDTGAGNFWLQSTSSSTSRTMSTYTGSGTHDGAGTPFAAGTPAELKSSATGWSLKGDGSVTISATKPIGGKPPTVQVLTSGTGASYSPPTGLVAACIEVVGAGGAGGGVTASATANHQSAGNSGGGGGYSRKWFTAAQLAAGACTYTVAGASTGGTGAAGANGGTTSFSIGGVIQHQATGGTGGARGTDRVSTTIVEDVSAGGVGSGGDVNVKGSASSPTIILGASMSGTGGSSVLGGGADGVRAGAVPSTSVGTAGGAYGAGGSGSANRESATNAKGGNGGAGVVIITEFYGA